MLLNRTYNAGQWEKPRRRENLMRHKYFRTASPLPLRKKVLQTEQAKKDASKKQSTKSPESENNDEQDVGEDHQKHSAPLNSIEQRIISEIDSSGLDAQEIFARIKSSILSTNDQLLNTSNHSSLNDFSSLKSFATTSTPIRSDKFLSCNLETDSLKSQTKQAESDTSKKSSNESNSSALKENVMTNTSPKQKNVRIKINVRKENARPNLFQSPPKMKGVKRNFIQENILNASVPRAPKRRMMSQSEPNTSRTNPTGFENDKMCVGSNPSAIFHQYGEGDGPLSSIRSFQPLETPTGSPKLWITMSPTANK